MQFLKNWNSIFKWAIVVQCSTLKCTQLCKMWYVCAEMRFCQIAVVLGACVGFRCIHVQLWMFVVALRILHGVATTKSYYFVSIEFVFFFFFLSPSCLTARRLLWLHAMAFFWTRAQRRESIQIILHDKYYLIKTCVIDIKFICEHFIYCDVNMQHCHLVYLFGHRRSDFAEEEKKKKRKF